MSSNEQWGEVPRSVESVVLVSRDEWRVVVNSVKKSVVMS